MDSVYLCNRMILPSSPVTYPRPQLPARASHSARHFNATLHFSPQTQLWKTGIENSEKDLTSAEAYLWTSGRGRKLSVEVISSPQSNMMVVDLNLSTLHGKVGCPDKQYWKNEIRFNEQPNCVSGREGSRLLCQNYHQTTKQEPAPFKIIFELYESRHYSFAIY